MPNTTAIIIFDGTCDLCNSSINFIIKHDKKNYYRFSTLQSGKGKKLLKKFNIDNTTSLVLIENNIAYVQSSAVLRISKHLNKLYPALYGFIIIPASIRNFLYDIIARNRYNWFGKQETCMIPTNALKSKFIG